MHDARAMRVIERVGDLDAVAQHSPSASGPCASRSASVSPSMYSITRY